MDGDFEAVDDEDDEPLDEVQEAEVGNRING